MKKEEIIKSLMFDFINYCAKNYDIRTFIQGDFEEIIDDWWVNNKQDYKLGKEEGDFKVGDNVKFKIRGIECEGNIMEFRDLALIHSDYGDYERKISELTKIK
jgi:hypothetical protein